MLARDDTSHLNWSRIEIKRPSDTPSMVHKLARYFQLQHPSLYLGAFAVDAPRYCVCDFLLTLIEVAVRQHNPRDVIVYNLRHAMDFEERQHIGMLVVGNSCAGDETCRWRDNVK